MSKTTLPLGITLPIQLGPQGYFNQAFDTNTQIKSNLINFFITKKGERPLNPGFGSQLWSTIFENKDSNPNLNDVCFTIVKNEADIWFPMIDVQNINVTSDTYQNNQYVVNIRIFFLNDRFEQNMDFVDITFSNTIV